MGGRWVVGVVGAMLACAAGCGSEPGAERREAGDSAQPVLTDVIDDIAWSPDGSRLVVTWDRGAGARLYGLLAGTAEAPPTPSRGLPVSDGRGAAATWSPDGLWVAYEAEGDVYRGRPDGTGAERLTTAPAYDGAPAYSPDGRTLLFVSERGGEGRRLWVMGADGSDPRPVPLGVDGDLEAPAWDPRGGRFAFHSRAAGSPTLYLGTLDGGVGRVTNGEQPAWSPDGSRIFFVHNDSIFSVPPDGGTRRSEVPDARAPAVSPDGGRLAFVRDDGEGTALFVRHLNQGLETRLTPEH